MIKAAFILIPLHSILAQIDVWSDEQGALNFYMFNIFAAMINIAFIANWSNEEKTGHSATPKMTVLESISLLGAYFIAAAHPYLYFTSIDGGTWTLTVSYQEASIGWASQLPQSGAQWVQVLYGLSLASILMSSVHTALRGIFEIAQSAKKPPNESLTKNRDWGPSIVSIQREVTELTTRLASIEAEPSNNTRKQSNRNKRKQGNLHTFEKMLDDPKT